MGNQEIIQIYRSAGVPKNMSNESILRYHKSGFGTDKAQIAGKYYQKFKDEAVIAHEYYNIFEDKLDKSREYYGIFGDNVESAQEYYELFNEEDTQIVETYYNIFGKCKANTAHKYYKIFEDKVYEAHECFEKFKKNPGQGLIYYKTFENNLDMAYAYYCKFGDRLAKVAFEYYKQFDTDIDIAREYYRVFGSSAADIARKYYDFFKTKKTDLEEQRSLVADYYQLFGKDIEKAKESYEKNGANAEKANIELMPGTTDNVKAIYYDMFKDNFERATEFYKVFGDKLPSEIDGWVRKTTCTAKDAAGILQGKVAPSALADVEFVLSLLPKLSKNSMLKFWDKYGTMAGAADKYVAYLRKDLAGFSGKRWSKLALEHIVYGAPPEVAKWLAKSELSPAQVRKVVSNYGDCDVWDVTLEEAQGAVAPLMVDVRDLAVGSVRWAEIWPGKLRRDVVAWCRKFDGNGQWVRKVFSEAAYKRRGLQNVVIARFLYCGRKCSKGDALDVYLSLGKLLEKYNCRLAENVESETYASFVKRVDILYSFFNKSESGKKFIDIYWRKGKNAAETNDIFSKRKEIHNELKKLLSKYSPD